MQGLVEELESQRPRWRWMRRFASSQSRCRHRSRRRKGIESHPKSEGGCVTLTYGRAGGEMARSLSSLSCSPWSTGSAWSCR